MSANVSPSVLLLAGSSVLFWCRLLTEKKYEPRRWSHLPRLSEKERVAKALSQWATRIVINRWNSSLRCISTSTTDVHINRWQTPHYQSCLGLNRFWLEYAGLVCCVLRGRRRHIVSERRLCALQVKSGQTTLLHLNALRSTWCSVCFYLVHCTSLK